MATDKINYAAYAGIHSTAAAILFAALYAPLLAWFLLLFIRSRTTVLRILTIFCAVRLTAFGIRAAMAGMEKAGEDLGLYIGFAVLFNIGFSGLLYSAFTLVFDRQRLFSIPNPSWVPSLLARLQYSLMRILMGITLVLAIAASNLMYQSNTASVGNTLRDVVVWIFLVLAVFLVLKTLVIAKGELDAGIRHQPGAVGHTRGIFFLVPMSVLLLLRACFTAATLKNSGALRNERLWYPLVVVPEFLAVVLFAVPGLVPSKAELAQRDQAEKMEMKDASAESVNTDTRNVHPAV